MKKITNYSLPEHANTLYKSEASSSIAIQRNAQLVCYVHSNFGNNKTLLVAGSSGVVYLIDNYNFTYSGTRDSLFTSHLERSFNGLKITDTNNVAWRLNVATNGSIYLTKY